MDQIADKTGPAPASRRRRVAAVLLSPLALTPLLVLSAWGEFRDYFPSSPATAVRVLAATALLPFMVGVPAGALAYFLAATFLPRARDWGIAALYLVTCAPVMVVVAGLNGGGGGSALVAGLLWGIPMAIAFGLILGWRRR